MKILIVGGVAGGASAAARLRRLNEHAEITLLERGEYISYANCGLPYYVGGTIQNRKALTLQTPESFSARFAVDVRVQNEAVAIDRAAKEVTVRDHVGGKTYTEKYDVLLLSPGAEPVVPPITGTDDPRVFTLRNIPDTLKLRAFIEERKPRRAVVVGGGYIGLEMAENLANAGLDVSVVELADHVIGPLDFDMASEVQRYLSSKGIHLYLSNGVRALRPHKEQLAVELIRGELAADLVLLSVGVRPETGLARAAGLKLDPKGAIMVDEQLRTSDPDIYAVGDAIAIKDLVSGKAGYVPLAGPANKQGRIAADAICGLPSTYRGTQGSSILRLFDMTVATTGLNERAAKAAGFDFDKAFTFSADHATYYPGATNMAIKTIFERESGRILGAQLVGFEGVDKRCDVLATAIRAGMTAIDLTELELCYAPPFSSAKDPVNMVGFTIENLLTNKLKQHHWSDVAPLLKDPNALLLDIRTDAEYQKGHIPGSHHILLEELRDRLDELDADKTIYVNCQTGLRSYIACRILNQRGFHCSNLAGGYRLYDAVMNQPSFDAVPAHSCGVAII